MNTKIKTLVTSIMAIMSLEATSQINQNKADGFLRGQSLNTTLTNQLRYNQRAGDTGHRNNHSDYWGDKSAKDYANKYETATWGQAINVDYYSGFTKGKIGFGLNAFATLGYRLADYTSAKEDAFAGLIGPSRGSKENSPANWGRASAAAKVRYSKTTIRMGEMADISTPVVAADSQITRDSFTGLTLTSYDLPSLKLDLGSFTYFSHHNYSNRNSRIIKDIEDYSARKYGYMRGLRNVDFVGFDYEMLDDTHVLMYFAHTQGVYERVFVGFNNTSNIDDAQRFIFTANAYQTRYENTAAAEQSYIDAGGFTHNRNSVYDNTGEFKGGRRGYFWSFAGTYEMRFHKLMLSYQRVAGASGFIYGYGDGISYVMPNTYYFSDFNSKNERSWQLKYSLDMRAFNIAGMSVSTGIIDGKQIHMSDAAHKPVADSNGNKTLGAEQEKFTEVNYIFEKGLLKNLDLSFGISKYTPDLILRQHTDKTRDTQYRVTINYTFNSL